MKASRGSRGRRAASGATAALVGTVFALTGPPMVIGRFADVASTLVAIIVGAIAGLLTFRAPFWVHVMLASAALALAAFAISQVGGEGGTCLFGRLPLGCVSQ